MNIKQDKSGDGLPISRIETIAASVVDPERVGYAGLDKTNCRDWLLKAGDILFSHINSVEHVGKCAVYRGIPEQLVHGMNLLCLRPDPSRLDPEFGKYLIRSASFKTSLSNFINKAVNQASVSIGNLRTIPVSLPPLPEQRRIAAILDQAETLRTQRRAALAQLDSLTQSLFLDMFGTEKAKEWPTTTIADITDEQNGSIRTGPFGSQLLHSEFVGEGIAVLGIDNAVANEFRWGERRFITQAKYRELQRYTVRPGDVLITIMGTCGRCAVVPNGVPVAINTKHLCCITVDQKKCLPLFLHAYFLRHPSARKYLEQTAKGAIMAGLNMGIIKAMPVSLPPLPLQQTFATRIQAIEALKTQHRAALAAQDALFASLQQRAFAGTL
ncbi:MAG: restriction endonuclease subunit S [Hydrogenophaga sp.]|uniref:restriction endonuclease subunit S n=1 Tax=Hydrogenophaga sp. TaxID=1904254 RepID=UPI0027705ED4|nr:restriction endonuclease subunit S [Hydrogenophaga sp.]MDP2419540.1 restriction endonuclease subunit S [Hydrogenophaga sp.]MDZ4189117.1 restriction endonuclease subunit S [Hydrogenophaga sp.]